MVKSQKVQPSDLLTIKRELPETAQTAEITLTQEEMAQAFELWKRKLRRDDAAYYLDEFFANYNVPDNAPFFGSKEKEDEFFAAVTSYDILDDCRESDEYKWRLAVSNWIKFNLVPEWAKQIKALVEDNPSLSKRMVKSLAWAFRGDNNIPTASEIIPWLDNKPPMVLVLALMREFVWGKKAQSQFEEKEK